MHPEHPNNILHIFCEYSNFMGCTCILPTESKAVQTNGRRTDELAEINLLKTLTLAELQNSDPDIVYLKKKFI